MNELQAAGAELHLSRLLDEAHRTLRTTRRGRALLLLRVLLSLAQRHRPRPRRWSR